MRRLACLQALLLATCAVVAVLAQCLAVSTDREVYLPGEEVVVYGLAPPNSTVTLAVIGPNGTPLWTGSSRASKVGLFSARLSLPLNASPGNYTVIALVGNETCSSAFRVLAPLPVLNGTCEVTGISSVKAYPGQEVSVEVLVKNTGTANGTFCAYTRPSGPLGEARACTSLRPGERARLVLKVPVSLKAPPGPASAPLVFAAYWPNGTQALEEVCGRVEVKVLATDVEVVLRFRLATGEPLGGALVYLNGTLIGEAGGDGSLKIRLIANRGYRVRVEKAFGGYRLAYGDCFRVELGGSRHFEFTVVPEVPCWVSPVIVEPGKVEQGGLVEVMGRFAIAPVSNESRYRLMLVPEWGEPVLVEAGRVKGVYASTFSYSLRAPDKPGVYGVRVVVEVDGRSYSSTGTLEVLRRREGCVRVVALYMEGEPASGALVRVGALEAVTGPNGTALVCGLEEGRYHVVVEDRLGEYFGEVRDVAIKAFSTRDVVVYLKPRGPCVEVISEGVGRLMLSRFTNWTFPVSLRVRRCMFRKPLYVELRVRGDGQLRVKRPLANYAVDAEARVKLVIPLNLTRSFNPGSRLRVLVAVVDRSGAELAVAEVYQVYVRDDVLAVIASPSAGWRLASLYALALLDLSLALLLGILYGGWREWPGLRTLARAIKAVRYPEKGALLAASAALYLYISYQLANALVNNGWFVELCRSGYAAVALLAALALALSVGVARTIVAVLGPDKLKKLVGRIVAALSRLVSGVKKGFRRVKA